MTTGQHAYRPRRDPAASAPKISEADRLSPAELARQRAQAVGTKSMRWKIKW